MNKRQISQLTIEAIALKSEYPNCREEIDVALARIREKDEENESEGFVDRLARNLEALIKRMPCAGIGKAPKRRKAVKGNKGGREQRRRMYRR
jgi:hypothetical protein